jgi:hypothetical protein
MNSWAPLSDGIVDSSIWEEPDHVFRVFIGMLSIKGADHIVRMDSYKLHRRLHMDHGLVLDALKVLSSPDLKRVGQPHEGRRLAAVEGGWIFLNGEAYRDQIRLIMKRARDARAQANHRARKAGKPLPYPPALKAREISYAEAEAHAGVIKAVKNLDAIQHQPEP